MIYNLLETFKEAYKIRGDDLIIENHSLKEGLYLKISEDGTIQSKIIQKKKKEEEPDNSKEYKWFRKADFYGGYLDSNKAIDKDNKVHSAIYPAFFIKIKTIKKLDKNNKVNTKYADPFELIKEYYEVLERDYCMLTEETYSYDKKKLMWVKTFLIDKWDVIENTIDELLKENQLDLEDSLKIFFDFNNWEVYQNESLRYLSKKVFNCNKYNISINGKVYGLSNSNIVLNLDKKPYREHKTMKCKVPFRIPIDDAILIYKYFKWLISQGYGNRIQKSNYSYEVPLISLSDREEYDDIMMLKLTTKNGLSVIEDFDIIPSFNKNRKIGIVNVLNTKEENKDNKVHFKIVYESGTNIYDSLVNIDKYLYGGNLRRNFDKEKKELKTNPEIGMTKNFINLLNQSSDSLFNFAYKGDEDGFKNIAYNIFPFLVRERLRTFGREKAADAFNTYVSCRNYINKEEDELASKITRLINESMDLLGKEDKDFNCIDEYSFVAGQIVYYLLSRNKADNKSHDLVEPFLTKHKTQDLNKEIKFWFRKYNYDIPMNFQKFNKAFSMVLGYESDEKINEDIFLAGYLTDNLFYMKREDVSDEE